MVQFNFTYDPNISVEQRVGFELAAMIWGSHLTDDITVKLHIASSDSLGTDGQAVGGAIPLFHEQNYGVYQQYAEADATSDTDTEALASQQEGNTVDFLVDGQVVDGNTNILLTSAQAKALGMDEALTLEGGGTWDRDLVDADALDGYILVSNSFDWNYDYTRSGEAPEGTLDFMSMALHEIGHQLGFVSSLDGTLDVNTLHSGETQAEGFSVLDLFRHSIDSNQVENPDGAVTDLSLGQNSYFSTDGGATNLANFANGVDYQASHWKRMQVALGIMDPTLAYKERVSLNYLDLQAMDVLGWDINYNALETGLDLEALLTLAENRVETSLGLSSTALNSSRSGGGEHGDLYALGYGEWWAIFEKHVLELGYGEWWSIFEMGYGEWKEQFENSNGNGNNGNGVLELGYGEWWQAFEANVLELGYGEWWQTFEADMLQLGYGEWWQLLELGYGEWWQQLETFFFTLDTVEGTATEQNSQVADGGVGGHEVKIFYGGENDDIIAGDEKQDRIKAGAGDDLIDGKEGHDVLWGEAGRDIIYGQNGNDLIYGGDDDDLLLGEAGDDDLHGEAGDDIASGGSGDDIVRGGNGNDDLKGGWGRDVVSGNAGDDRLEGESGNDIVIGGEGRDQVNGGGGDDILYGDDYLGTEMLQQLRTLLQQQPTSSQSQETSEGNVASNGIGNVTFTASEFFWTGDYSDSLGKAYIDGSATGTVLFSGDAGDYMLVAHYFDELTAGDSTLAFSLNGTQFNNLVLDDDDAVNHTRTIAQKLTLSDGDILTIDAISDEQDNVLFSSLDLISLDNLLVTSLDTEPNQGTTTTSVINSTTQRVEAESMFLAGGYHLVEDTSFASGEGYISLNKQTQGKALTSFAGESGYYNIIVGYNDVVASRAPKLVALLDGVELDQWSLTQNLGTEDVSADNFLTRTVASGIHISSGDVFELQGFLGKYNGTEKASVDYIDFVQVDAPEATTSQSSTDSALVAPSTNEPLDIAPSTPVVIGDAIRIEAESMNLNGYSTESNNNPSGGELIRTWSSGTAKTNFSGDSGYYNIVVAYYDENDGQATLSASLGGVALDEWQLAQDLGSTYISSGNLVTRTVEIQVWVNTGDELTLEGLRDSGEYARIDYVEFVPVSTPVVIGEALRIESESMNLNGYIVESHSDPSSGQLIKTNSSGTAKTDFSGDSGYYNIVVAYYDETDGQATLSASLGGVALDEWQLTQDLGSSYISSGNQVTRTVESQIWVNTGDELTLEGLRNSGEYARIDYVEFVRVAAPDSAVIEAANDDFLQGGAGNDTLYGGVGNDTLYGESQSDNASNILKGSHTYNGHTYLISSFGTWAETQAEAQRLGGNLVTLNDAAEEDWIKNTFGTEDKFLIGINDQSVEGTFEWVSGEASTYTNWAPGEPSSSGNQDFGTLNFGTNKQWDDIGPGDARLGIIEINTTNNDILVGGSGDDTLYGNGGDDALYGDTLDNNSNNGLVGYWNFDETSGQQAEDAAGENIGKLTNMAGQTWTSGAIGGALDFSGDDDHVLVADTAELDITQTLTLATWVNADVFKSWAGLIMKGTDNISYALDLGSDGRLIFDTNSGALSGASGQGTFYSNSSLTIDQWQHVAVTYDGSNVQFYIDGQLDSSTQANITFGTSNEALVIGADLARGSHFDGDLDDVRVYDRALSAEELAQLSAGEVSVSVSGEGGNDFLYGGVGSDTLEGGAGDDVLYGTDAIAAGYFETDILGGGLGADTFILGNANQAYYLGGGDKDFALIQDFNAAEDVVQLHGSASDYTQQQQGNDTFLYYQGSSSELVAVFENVDSVNLNTGFVFV